MLENPLETRERTVRGVIDSSLSRRLHAPVHTIRRRWRSPISSAGTSTSSSIFSRATQTPFGGVIDERIVDRPRQVAAVDHQFVVEVENRRDIAIGLLIEGIAALTQDIEDEGGALAGVGDVIGPGLPGFRPGAKVKAEDVLAVRSLASAICSSAMRREWSNHRRDSAVAFSGFMASASFTAFRSMDISLMKGSRPITPFTGAPWTGRPSQEHLAWSAAGTPKSLCLHEMRCLSRCGAISGAQMTG